MKKQNVLRSTAYLMLSGLIAKTVDFIFRAYYSQKIGSEGLGILSLCFAAHGIMLTISSGGIGIAVSKLVSQQLLNREYSKSYHTISIAVKHVALVSLAVMCVSMLAGSFIAETFLKEPRGFLCIVYISPSILFMGISYCIKGYFYAARRVLLPALSEFLEQFVKISVITVLLSRWLPQGVQKGCEAICLGVSIGEMCSCLYLLVFYGRETKNFEKQSGDWVKIYPSIIKIAVPVMISAFAISLLRLWEDVLVIASLKKSGFEHKIALEIYGSIKGMIMPLVVFPLTLLSSFFTMLVPEISRACSMQCKVRLKTLVSRIYRFCTIFSFAVMCVFLVFSETIADGVYSAPEISGRLRIISLFIPFMFMDSVSAGMLNGMGKQTKLLLHGFGDSVLRIVLVCALMPTYGINAFLLVIAASNIFTCILSVRAVLKTAEMHFCLSDWLLKNLLCSATTVYTVQSFFTGSLPDWEYAAVWGICFTVAVYILWAGSIGKNTRRDIKWLLSRAFMP